MPSTTPAALLPLSTPPSLQPPSLSPSSAARLGRVASRWYEISLPALWTWQRSTLGKPSTYGVYDSPLFDERFSVSEDNTALTLVVQSNARSEVTPLFPWGDAYCLTEVLIHLLGKPLRATVYSDVEPVEKMTLYDDSCQPETTARLLDTHIIEFRVCVDNTGIATPSDIALGPYHTCPQHTNPQNADFLRFTLSCQGTSWAGSGGRERCVSLLQAIIDSVVRHHL